MSHTCLSLSSIFRVPRVARHLTFVLTLGALFLGTPLADAGPIRLSALLLGTSLPDGTFVPRLHFGGETGAFGYLELYNVPKGSAATVQLEVAPAPDAPAIASSDVDLAPGPVEDVRIAYSGFSIETMPPGDYVMRAIVKLDGKELGRATRTLRRTK